MSEEKRWWATYPPETWHERQEYRDYRIKLRAGMLRGEWWREWRIWKRERGEEL